MSKMRIPESFEDAALDIMHGLGVQQMALIVSRSEGAIRAWNDPDKDGRPVLHQAVILDAAYARDFKGQTPFLAAYLKMLKQLNKEHPISVEDVLSEALDLPAVVGSLMCVIRKAKSATSDGGKSITPKEHRDIRAVMRDLRRELDELEAAVDQEAGYSNA